MLSTMISATSAPHSSVSGRSRKSGPSSSRAISSRVRWAVASPLGSHKLLFVQLGLPELAGQLVAFGYKNVRINEAVLLEEGQRLILTGEFRYFFVEGNDVLAPEQPAITDRPEGFEHLLQNGEALMLELIVEAAEGFIRLRFRHGLDGAVAFFHRVGSSTSTICH